MNVALQMNPTPAIRKDWSAPRLIEMPKVGASEEGYISIAESSRNIPFEVKRCFWTYFTPESITRGRHAHYLTEQILIAVAGRITVSTESAHGELHSFIMEKPNIGLYIPPNVWHRMEYTHNAVQLVLASTFYDEKDYIRSYEDFRRIYQ